MSDSGLSASPPAASQDGTTTAMQPTVTSASPRAGKIVLVAAVVLAAVSVTASIVLGVLGAPYVDRTGGGFQVNFSFGDPRPIVSILGIASPLHAVGGGLIGLWIIVQSIVSIAADWGRTAGIVALILAVVTPLVSFALFMTLLLTLG